MDAGTLQSILFAQLHTGAASVRHDPTQSVPLPQNREPSPVTNVAQHPDVATRNANVTLMLLVAAGIVGLYSMTTHPVPFGKGFEMVKLAENLARYGSYANPFDVLDTGPTAANPPLYAFLLALVIKAFRIPDLVLFVVTLGNIFANAFAAMLLPRISEMFYRDTRPGLVAAILWILSSQLMPSWDVGFTVPTLFMFCLVTAATIGKPGFAIKGLFAGLLAAALFLFNPSTILIFFPWMGWLAVKHRKSGTQTVAYCCLVFGVVLVFGAAWGLRNQRELGKFVIRTNLGMTLYASDNACASSSMVASEANNCYQEHHPNTSFQEAQLLHTLGEVKYDQVRVTDAKQWIRSHPSQFLRLTLARVRDFWFPIPNQHPFKSGVIWAATLLSIPGLILMIRRRIEITPFVLSVLLIYPLMYYIVVSDVRYRLPVLWLSLLPAGVFVVQLWDIASKSNRSLVDPI